MIDYDILAEYGTTDEVLRQFFTAQEPTPLQRSKLSPSEYRVIQRNIKNRQKFEKYISGLLQEHIVFSLTNHSKYAAVDMAWDSFPINQVVVPLMQYAQGRIDLARIQEWTKNEPMLNGYLRKNEGGEVIGVDMPKFFEVNINLLRSVITRRRAAIVQKYDRLWPYFKYEPRDQSQVGKLRADMVSQRMDIMADQFGYRHLWSQVVLHMMLYSKSVAFPRAYWEREVQVERMPGDIKLDEKGKIRKRTRVVKEGLSWVLPHPSRVFYDNLYPITTLNEDNGCEYVGFWDVTRWGNIANNSDYFNRRKVSYTSGMVDWFSTYWAYFNQYFTTIIPPSLPQARGDNVNFVNDRLNQVGLFTGQMEQVSTIFSHLWMKVRPQNWGWGRYPHPIWVHLKVAGDATVVYSKIWPSSPGAVASHNENDSRLFNISLAHELMPYQDQLTNLFSQLLEIIKQDLFAVCVLNTDVFPDNAQGKKAIAEFEALLENRSQYTGMQALEVSFTRLKELGIEPGDAFKIVRGAPNTNIEQVFKAIVQIIGMANGLVVRSSQEQGQSESHEMSATESHGIAQSVNTVEDFLSSGIDEARSAMKRICFDHTIACGTDQVELTVANRYPAGTIQSAGFEGKQVDADDPTGYTRITGNKASLVHEYIFSSRDGGDRPAGQQAATVLVQMLQALGSLQPDIQQAILHAMGKEKVFEIFNQIFRSIDAGVDMKLEVKPGEDDTLLITQQQQFMQSFQRMAEQVQKESEDLNQVHQAINALFEIIGKMNPQAGLMVAQAMRRTSPEPPPVSQNGNGAGQNGQSGLPQLT